MPECVRERPPNNSSVLLITRLIVHNELPHTACVTVPTTDDISTQLNKHNHQHIKHKISCMSFMFRTSRVIPSFSTAVVPHTSNIGLSFMHHSVLSIVHTIFLSILCCFVVVDKFTSVCSSAVRLFEVAIE